MWYVLLSVRKIERVCVGVRKGLSAGILRFGKFCIMSLNVGMGL